MSTPAKFEKLEKIKVNFERVLIATDFSAASQGALSYAVAIVRRYRSEISLVHALSPEIRTAVPMDPEPRELSRERLQAEKQMQLLKHALEEAGIACHVVIEKGQVWDVLSSAIEKTNPDLLVLGTHGRGTIKKLLLGSVAEEVIRLAPCPVLTVGPRAIAPRSDVATFSSILYATDLSFASTKAVAYALLLAESCHARLILLHLVPPRSLFDIGPAAVAPSLYPAEQLQQYGGCRSQESLRTLQQLIPPDAKLDSAPEYLVETSFLPEGILDSAGARGAELIIMGVHRTPVARFAAHIPWAVTHDVLCQAKCPVLTVAG
jgi:nucleotide-binding universal stress UspA family protein